MSEDTVSCPPSNKHPPVLQPDPSHDSLTTTVLPLTGSDLEYVVLASHGILKQAKKPENAQKL
jgi:hypothetical protein